VSWIKSRAPIGLRYSEGLASWLSIICGLMMWSLMVITVYEVVLRYFFHNPPTWSMPVAQYALLWIVSLSISYTQARGTHIKIDAIIVRAPQQIQTIVGMVVSVLAILFFILFTWSGINYSLEIFREARDSGPTLFWPLFPIIVIMPVGGFLMVLQLLTTLTKQILSR
jgi:TRAP-type C4-dicarboxylate transport system permease small subunit